MQIFLHVWTSRQPPLVQRGYHPSWARVRSSIIVDLSLWAVRLVLFRSPRQVARYICAVHHSRRFPPALLRVQRPLLLCHLYLRISDAVTFCLHAKPCAFLFWGCLVSTLALLHYRQKRVRSLALCHLLSQRRSSRSSFRSCWTFQAGVKSVSSVPFLHVVRDTSLQTHKAFGSEIYNHQILAQTDAVGVAYSSQWSRTATMQVV